VRWLTKGDAASACLLLSATGTIGEFPPLVDSERMKQAAATAGFFPLDQWPLPDGRIVTMWRRHLGLVDCGFSGQQMSERGAESTPIATFGSWATLERYSYEPTKEGVELHLHWRAIQPLTPDILVAVHLIDEKGNILTQHVTEETVTLPWSQLNAAVNRLAIGLYTKNGSVIMAPIDRGSRDWDGHRLLLTLPN
jgi:hypothetical protein